MADIIPFRCLNCGHRFEASVLDENEKRDARHRNQGTMQLRCPKCGRDDLRRGRD